MWTLISIKKHSIWALPKRLNRSRWWADESCIRCGPDWTSSFDAARGDKVFKEMLRAFCRDISSNYFDVLFFIFRRPSTWGGPGAGASRAPWLIWHCAVEMRKIVSICLSVCLSVCLCLFARVSKFHEVLCTCDLWLCLGFPLTTMWHILSMSGLMDKVTFSQNESSGAESRTTLCVVELARRQHRRRSCCLRLRVDYCYCVHNIDIAVFVAHVQCQYNSNWCDDTFEHVPTNLGFCISFNPGVSRDSQLCRVRYCVVCRPIVRDSLGPNWNIEIYTWSKTLMALSRQW